MSKDAKTDRLFLEKVRRLIGQTALGVIASLINAFILSFILWDVAPKSRVILWFFSVSTISLIRLYLQQNYQKMTSDFENTIKGRNYFLLTLGASGIIWGSAGVLLFPSASVGHQVFIAFVLGGMIAGSVGVFSVFITAYLAYSIPAFLPIAIMFFTVGGEMHYAMGAMCLLFWIIMFVTAKRLNREIIQSLNLKFENIDLISELEMEIDERKKAEKRLLKRNQEIEEIVQNRTSELQQVNTKLIEEVEERKQAEKTAWESEEKYRELADSLPQIVFEIDERRTLTYTNRNAFELFGYTEEDFEKGLNVLQMLIPEERERAVENIQKLLEGAKSEGIEYTAQRKDGSTFPVLIHASLIIRDKAFKGLRGIVIDLTERKRAEKEQKKLEAQLQQAQKMEAIGTLAGGVAHDLNNILSGIVSYPDLLLMQIPEDSPLKKPILTMQESGQKAAVIVQDLLTLTRRGVVTEEVVNLNDVITEYMKSPEYKKMISFHPGVRMEAGLDEDLLNIIGSPIHLSKTVMNLVSNAAEASIKGGKIQITTMNRYIEPSGRDHEDMAEGDYVVLTVADTGSGISHEDQERIFEPFFTKKVMGKSGTGLGMAVVWGTVKDHKGYIDVQSSEGKGSTFTLYFPATREDVKEDMPHPINKLNGKGESIIVVDDVREQREIASALLSQLGYSVDTFSSGEEAVEYLKKNRADLIVLDMIMDPNMDGLDTYRKILELHPMQKAIIATGFSETERVKEAQRLGAGTYVKKPYTLRKIGSAVRNELDR